jgi:cyclophilin family peptidyl-prolyl cis-trans isomerase/protein-disulfide isomerase
MHMKSKLWFVLILVMVCALLLTACAGQDPNPAVDPVEPENGSQEETGSGRLATCSVQSEAVPDLARSGDHITGELEDYSVTIIAYSDFSCERCVTIATTMTTALDSYPDDIRLIYRHYTSPARNPIIAARAAHAAASQDKFIETYRAFYHNAQDWLRLDEQGFNGYIQSLIEEQTLEPDQFFTDISSDETFALIDEQYLASVEYVNLLLSNFYPEVIAAAGEAAGEQHLFWEMYQQILATQPEWGNFNQPELEAYLEGLAAGVSLDAEQFAEDFDRIMSQEGSPTPGETALTYFRLMTYTPIGVAAAKAAEAAGMQGKFWEMHDLLFANQELWADSTESDLLAFLSTQYEALGIDSEQFGEDYRSPEIDQKILENFVEIRDPLFPAPRLLVNGTDTPPYLTTIGDFFSWIETLMIPYGRHIKTQQFSECPPMTIDPEANYTATLHTEKGDIVLALYPDVAPLTVNNFIFLAENNYYDNTPWYAVIEGFVAQAGDPSGTGWGTPGFLYDLEITSEVTFERPYMLAMTNSGPGTSNSQFFITFSPLTYLNGQYTIFGEVLEGVEVLKALKFRDPERDPLAPPSDMLLDVTIEKE